MTVIVAKVIVDADAYTDDGCDGDSDCRYSYSGSKLAQLMCLLYMASHKVFEPLVVSC